MAVSIPQTKEANMAKHLSYEERNAIETALNQGVKIQTIAAMLQRDRKTVSEEIKRNGEWVLKGSYGRGFTRCEHSWRKECKQAKLCHESRCHERRYRNRCQNCSHCESVCPQFKEAECEKLRRSPYCCNACKDRARCTIAKFIYLSVKAHTMSTQRKERARQGCSYSHSELEHMSKLLHDGSMKGQSFHHIYISNCNDFFCSQRNLYLLKDRGLLNVKNLDMPATVQRKVRKKRQRQETKVDKHCRTGRSYKDYQTFMNDYPGVMAVQMDVVEGLREDLKCFLALSWPHLQLSLYYLMERQTARCVEETLQYLHKRLGTELFQMLFPIILTDNGSEFSNPSALESLGTRIFYCDPMASYQKGHVENQNRLLRRIIPKGHSIQQLQFEDSFIINANLNSWVKLSVNNRTPIRMLKRLYPKEVIEALHLYEVPPNDVVLLPHLLQDKVERI